MQLINDTDVPQISILRTVRTARWPNMLFLIACIGVTVFGIIWIASGPDIPLVAWIVVGPFVVINALVLLILVPSLVHAVRAGFRSTNWYLKIAHDGLYLKFRSYLNFHFGGDAKTVVFIPYSEIEAAGKHSWRMDLKVFSETSTLTESRLKLYLRDVNTKPLRHAIIAEKNFKPAMHWRSSLKFGDLPVNVYKDGKVYVRWPGRRAVRELEKFITMIDPFVVRTGNMGGATTQKSEEDLILELVERGDIVKATFLAKQTYGMNTTEARAFINQLSHTQA